MASMSGRPVRREGVGLVIGDDSSSESEDDNGDEETCEFESESLSNTASPLVTSRKLRTKYCIPLIIHWVFISYLRFQGTEFSKTNL